MTAQENCHLTQELFGNNFNVNGNLYIFNCRDIDPETISKLVYFPTKENKHGIFSRIKRWFQKKFSRSAKDDTEPVHKSSRGTNSSPNKCLGEHSFLNGEMPVTKDECGSSALADDDCVSNHSPGCVNFNNTLDDPTSRKQLLMKPSRIDDDASESCLNKRDCNGGDITEVTQLERHQEELYLRFGLKNMSRHLKTLSGKNPVDESNNYRNKIANAESSRKEMNDAFECCEPLSSEMFKQTEPNAMNDHKITDLKNVSDRKRSDSDCLNTGKFSDKLVVTEEVPIGNQTVTFRYSTLPSSCDEDVVAVQQKKRTRKCKKKYRKECKKSDSPHGETSSLASSSWNESVTDENSISFGYDLSNHQEHKPRRRKWSPENTKPPCRDNSDIEQFCSSPADSGVGASLDPVSWFTYGVDSEVIENHKRKKKIGSFGSLRHVKNSYSFKKRCNHFFRCQQKKKVKSFVRELHVNYRYLQFMHFGLGSYFDRLNNLSPPSLQEQMRHEWIRLASFQHYTGAGNALNLARNGFYHSHTDGPLSTRCAYCDETRSNWEYFDNIETVHRQLSPNCPFHGDRSEESLNVSINNNDPEVSNNLENAVSFYPSASVREVSKVNGNIIKPSANPESVIGQVDNREHPECIPHRAAPYQPRTTAVTSRVDQNRENSAVQRTSAGSTYTLSLTLTLTSAVEEVASCLENISVSQANPNNTNGESVSQQPTEDPEGRERRTGEHVSGLARASSNDPVRNHAPQTQAPVKHDSIPPTLENVKHPEFTTMAHRVNSFQGFPDYLDQTPEQMALAGFYFMGGADFTRCFCCGGGLRNWEAGDDPLLEHTRWFPRCEYVLRLKGERYVAAVQRRHQEHMEQQRRQQIEIANQRDANRNPPDPMTTDAASVMREMGYAEQRIRETILIVRRQIGTHMLTTQQVLSWLLDQDDDSTTTTVSAASSMYQTGNETNSIYPRMNMAREQDDSSYRTAAPSSINTTVSTNAVKTREPVQGSCAPSGSINASTTSSENGNQQTHNNATSTDTVRKLCAENKKLRDMQTCKICMDRPANTTMLPCGHFVCCYICASRLRDCPVCRKRIEGILKTYMS